MNDDRHDIRPEVDRLVAWLVATFEVEHGVDLRDNRIAMDRLAEVSRITHAQRDGRDRDLHIDSLESGKSLVAHLTAAELDAIFEGRAEMPDVEAARAARAPRKSGASSSWLYLVIIALVIATFAAAALYQGHGRHETDTHHGEHKK